MHGLILSELKRFAETSFGKAAWREPFIKPQWKTLEMIEHTEANIHRAVRLRDPGAAPPELDTDLTCMLKGKPTCTIAVKLVSAS